MTHVPVDCCSSSQRRQPTFPVPPAQSQPVTSLVGGEQGLECRRFEVAGLAVEIRQDLKGSNALKPLDDDRVWGDDGGEAGASHPLMTAEDLSRVGLVVWQAGFVLADVLLRRPPYGSWHGAQVLDLGCGTGLVGILLALAGAEVTLSDQPHIVPLAEANVKANLVPGLHRAQLVPYTWGQGDPAAALLSPAATAGTALNGNDFIAVGVDDAAATCLGAECAGSAAAAAVAEPQKVLLAGCVTAGATAAADAAAGLSPALLPAAAQAQACPAGTSPLAPCYDVIVAADVVYQPECYATLAATLRAVSAPHTVVFVSFKRRGLQEGSFLGLLDAAGFAVQEVPQAQLAEEYRGGSYCVVRACRID